MDFPPPPLLTSRTARLLEEFNSAHLGTAHGLARVLSHLAYALTDSSPDGDIDTATIPAYHLINMAAELSATLPPPYGLVLTVCGVKGLRWPENIGDYTLLGPTNNTGFWRWYARTSNGISDRIRVDNKLQPIEYYAPAPTYHRHDTRTPNYPTAGAGTAVGSRDLARG